MIKHIVLFQLKGELSPEQRQSVMDEFKKGIDALPAIIPEIKFMQIGRDVSRTDMSYDMMLVTRFESLDALHTYKVHPAHVEVASYVAKVKVARVVLDCEIDSVGELI
jgi:hypothetical protein